MIEPDPEDWGWWVIYLLEQMGEEAKRGRKRDNFKLMLQDLSDDIE